MKKKIALCMTTITKPEVLELYQEYSDGVRFFVAGDAKSHNSVEDYCRGIRSVRYISLQEQADCHTALHLLTGTDTVARRNFALLEALKWGADYLVFCDDDNYPLSVAYFLDFLNILSNPFTGLRVSSPTGWFDPGELLEPRAPHRGFPVEVQAGYEVSHAINAQVGAAAGICLGDPDIAAYTRLANHPIVHRPSTLLEAGLILAPNTLSVFNSQNTAFLARFAPCFVMLPQLQRYDDIFASLLAQRIMREFDHTTHFGRPFVWQQRNPHNLVRDLAMEMWGYEKMWVVAGHLSRINLSSDQNVYDKLRRVFREMTLLLPETMIQLAQLWLDTTQEIERAAHQKQAKSEEAETQPSETEEIPGWSLYAQPGDESR